MELPLGSFVWTKTAHLAWVPCAWVPCAWIAPAWLVCAA